MVRFIDLFAGIGGIRKGFELACDSFGLEHQCVFTSEIKTSAIEILHQNNPKDYVSGDITKIDPSTIEDFDFLLGGFPCQAFSAAGKRQGFNDTRGTLFFNVADIIRVKKPLGFILENVEGLVNHDMKHADSGDKIGHTLRVILNTLQYDLGYEVNWKVLDASEFGVPQRRKRIYIVGTRLARPNLENFDKTHTSLESILEHGLAISETPFTKKLIDYCGLNELPGKACKDKRGGANNIHSWDLEIHGALSKREKTLLNLLLTERRKKKWAQQYGIDWMDGMPLTYEMIRTFSPYQRGLQVDLDDCVNKKYLRLEHPKRLVEDAKGATHRTFDFSLPKGYNIVTGKMSFEVNEVLDPKKTAPTLVAMDMRHLFVVDGEGIRPLSHREGLRLFGYPDDFLFNIGEEEGYDLLGNTVVVPVIRSVSESVLSVYLHRGGNL